MTEASNFINKPHQHSGVESYMAPPSHPTYQPQYHHHGRQSVRPYEEFAERDTHTDAKLVEFSTRKARILAELAALNDAPDKNRITGAEGLTVAIQITNLRSKLQSLETEQAAYMTEKQCKRR
jgi:hypothetical protein